MFDSYEKEFQGISTTITAKIDALPNASGGDKAKATTAIEKELLEADSLVQQMDLEVRSMAGAVRSELQGRVRGYKAALAEMKKRFQEARSAFSSAVTQREELLQGGKRSSELTQEAHGQRARLLQSTESLQTSSTRLEQTQRIVMETEEIGTSILTDLAEQRETLEHTRDRLRGMDTDLGRSRKILTSMARRAWANKFIMVFIIIALVMFIALIVYIQWFSSPAKTKANARRLLVQLRT